MKKTGWLTGGALILIMAFGSCRKDPLKNLTNEESRIYISNYDTTANFSNFATFSITDSVDVIQDNQLYARERTDYDAAVLNALAQNLTQRGYQQVNRESNPDLAVNVARVYSTSTGLFSYGDYWGYYGGYWDPFYYGYPGYGFYPPYYSVGTYSITTGGLEIDLLDLKNAPSRGNKVTPIWTGLARGEQVFRAGNAASTVQALFDQSAYIKH